MLSFFEQQSTPFLIGKMKGCRSKEIAACDRRMQRLFQGAMMKKPAAGRFLPSLFCMAGIVVRDAAWND